MIKDVKDTTLNILMLEDVEEDAELTIYEIRKSGFKCEYIRVDNLEDFKIKLFEFLPHIILSDYNLPTCNALDAYKLVAEIKLPFIIVSGIVGDEKAVEALKMGVTDLVSKDSLYRLPLAIERAVNEQRSNQEKMATEHELIINKERLELALEGTDLGIWDLDLSTRTIVYNEKSLNILGFDESQAIQDFTSFINPDDEKIQKALEDHIAGKTEIFDEEIPVRPEGKEIKRWVLARGKIIRRTDKGKPIRASGTLLDITDRKNNEILLQKNRYILENAESVAHVGSFEWNTKSLSFFYSEEFERIFELNGRHDISAFEIYRNRIHEQDKSYFREMLISRKEHYDIEHRIVMPDGGIKIVRNIGNISVNKEGRIETILGVIQDITEQRQLIKSIFNAQQDERSRIARDIHDGIGQMLVASKFKLASLDTQEDDANSKKDDVEDLIGTIIEEVRRVSRNMSNRHLEEFGLNTALNNLVDQTKHMGDFNVEHKIDIPQGYDMELSNAIYRIAQEAINNISKYANAKNVSIRIEKIDQNIILEIKDDGVGFDTKTKWNGIKNMKERTSLQNGHFEINSVPNEGTVVKSWFPLNN